MTSGRCIFCGSAGPLTAEHPLSKSVLELAGFALDDITLEIDVPLGQLTAEYVEERMRPIRDAVVRCVCRDCNNGWMQDLDHSFAGTIKRWVDAPSDRLGLHGLRVVSRYLLKVMWVRLLGERWAAGPIQSGELTTGFVPNPDHGELIRAGKIEDLASRLSVGAAALPSEVPYAYAVFNPKIEGLSTQSGLLSFSGGLVVALPPLRLQLWLVYRLSELVSTAWPPGVTWLGPGSRFSYLSVAPALPQTDAVRLAID